MDHRLFSHSHIKFGTNHKNHIIMTIHYQSKDIPKINLSDNKIRYLILNLYFHI